MKTSDRKRFIIDNYKLNILKIFIYFIIIFLLEFSLFEVYLKNFSIEMAKKFKNNLNINLCEILSFLLCSKWIFIFICGIIYNFSTVYKLFIFIQNIFITCFIISIIQLIKKDELVYYNDEIKYKLDYCVSFYGTPSIVSALTVIGSLTIRHFFIKKK